MSGSLAPVISWSRVLVVKFQIAKVVAENIPLSCLGQSIPVTYSESDESQCITLLYFIVLLERPVCMEFGLFTETQTKNLFPFAGISEFKNFIFFHSHIT